MLKSKILFLLSGSIAGFKAAQVISRLVQYGHEVQCVATPSTFNFVGAATLEGLTGKKVLSDIWESGRAMEHIHLTRWADLGVLCPATAASIARIAHGMADDLVSTMALAWEPNKPFHIFPAMNHQMLKAKTTQDNLNRLHILGFNVAPTNSGTLACGEEGGGRLLEADQIVARIQGTASPRGRVLVTAGATRENIDGIRFISNVSTGQTGAELSDRLAHAGFTVTHMHGMGAQLPKAAHQLIAFEGFEDLDEKLRAELAANSYDGILHCAAVSDYSIGKLVSGTRQIQPDESTKLDSTQKLSVELKPNFKILPRLKEYSRNKKILVVGFKLTLNKELEESQVVATQMLNDSVDAVVANDWHHVSANRDLHPGVLVDTKSTKHFADLNELGFDLIDLFSPGKDKPL